MRGSLFPIALALTAFLAVPAIPLKAEAPLPVGPKIEGADTPAGKKIAEKLHSIVLDKVDFEKLDVSAALDFLTRKSKELDPRHEGVPFRLELPSKSESKKSIHREVSITLDNVPIADLLLYICQQTNLTYKIVKGVVVLTSDIPAPASTHPQ